MNETTFKAWPKINRPKNNTITITEKIDGTNACVIVENGEIIGVQSRNRMIKVGDDNMGFASFVDTNKKDIVNLGDGYHYGEWAGPDIQKNPHKLEVKTFFLFNVFRPQESLPDCVKVVPMLYHGPSSEKEINATYCDLWESAAAENYTPEGLIVYYHESKSYLKYTYANKEGKWNYE